jgi:hypothetical protein
LLFVVNDCRTADTAYALDEPVLAKLAPVLPAHGRQAMRSATIAIRDRGKPNPADDRRIERVSAVLTRMSTQVVNLGVSRP